MVNIKFFKTTAMAFFIAMVTVPGAFAQSGQALITVMNPVVESKMADRVPLSPRLDTLEGKTLYLADINWGGPDAAYSVYQQMEAWFAANMPSVKVVIKRKSGSFMTDDPGLWQEIADKGDAAVVGISG
jgi:hypothetical protein